MLSAPEEAVEFCYSKVMGVLPKSLDKFEEKSGADAQVSEALPEVLAYLDLNSDQHEAFYRGLVQKIFRRAEPLSHREALMIERVRTFVMPRSSRRILDRVLEEELALKMKVSDLMPTFEETLENSKRWIDGYLEDDWAGEVDGLEGQEALKNQWAYGHFGLAFFLFAKSARIHSKTKEALLHEFDIWNGQKKTSQRPFIQASFRESDRIANFPDPKSEFRMSA